MKRMTDDPSAMQHISLSQAQQAELRTDFLGEKLSVMISNLPTSGVSLTEIRDIVGQDGLFTLSASWPEAVQPSVRRFGMLWKMRHELRRINTIRR